MFYVTVLKCEVEALFIDYLKYGVKLRWLAIP